MSLNCFKQISNMAIKEENKREIIRNQFISLKSTGYGKMLLESNIS